jgi:hypothetical protein
MRSPATRILVIVTGGVLLAAAYAAAPRAQTQSSGQLAKELVSALASGGLDAIATRDPEKPDRAIAALAFPGSQLLVVSAPYADASLDALLANRMYRDVYSTLQQPSIADGKVFIQDLGCDGLQPGGVDIMYENGKTQTILDGNWKKQGLSQSAYEQRAKDAEARYSRMLAALVGAARKAPR